MNAHADLSAQLAAIMKMLPDEGRSDEAVRAYPNRSRADAGRPRLEHFAAYRVSDARIMRYLRNNMWLPATTRSIFTFGKADRARTSATYREILDAMWLFNDKFERARGKFAEIKAQETGRAR
jgi:hypothetical protein